VKRLKLLEQENGRLRKAVADLTLELLDPDGERRRVEIHASITADAVERAIQHAQDIG